MPIWYILLGAVVTLGVQRLFRRDAVLDRTTEFTADSLAITKAPFLTRDSMLRESIQHAVDAGREARAMAHTHRSHANDYRKSADSAAAIARQEEAKLPAMADVHPVDSIPDTMTVCRAWHAAYLAKVFEASALRAGSTLDSVAMDSLQRAVSLAQDRADHWQARGESLERLNGMLTNAVAKAQHWPNRKTSFWTGAALTALSVWFIERETKGGK